MGACKSIPSVENVVRQNEVSRKPSRSNEKTLVICLNRTKTNLAELSKMTEGLRIVNDSAEMEKTIRQSNSKKVYLVFTDSPEENVVQQIEKFPQIESIYDLKSFQTMTSLCDQLKIDLKQTGKSLVSFDLMENFTSNSSHQQNKQDAAFMYTQLFNELILKSEENDLKSMWKFCRTMAKNDVESIKFLNEFETTYQKENAIWWYTRESFFFRMLNEALRYHKYEIIYECRVFIRHLHEQILFEYQKTKNSKIELYRGLRIDEKDLKNFQEKIGGLLSIPNFLSTSIDLNIAEGFAQGTKKDQLKHPEKTIHLLMEILVDEQSLFPVADVRQLSYYVEEEEYLFSMGVVFRIESLNRSSDGFYHLKLRTTSDSDPILTQLKDYYREKILKDKNILLNFARLFYELGKFHQSKYFFLEGFKNEKHWKRHVQIYNNLGSVEMQLNNDDEALQFYEKALDLELKNGGETSKDLSAAYNNIASLYYKQKKFHVARGYFFKAENALQYVKDPNPEYVAGIYHNIGVILAGEENYDDALEYHKKCLEIQQDHYKAPHPKIAASCRSIAMAYRFRNSFDEAIQYAEKAVEIVQNTLPEGHHERTPHEHFLRDIKEENNE